MANPTQGEKEAANKLALAHQETAAKFDKTLNLFVTSTEATMKHAKTCAIMALEHFEAHGQVAYIERFFNACKKNFIRREAFLKWAGEFSPLTKNAAGNLCKDTSEHAKPFNIHGLIVKDDKGEEITIKGADSVVFWEFAPDKEVKFLAGGDNVVVEFQKVVKRLENKNNFQLGQDAILKLAAIKRVLDAVPPIVLENEDEEKPAATASTA